jgi:hypothetical protein
MKIKSLAPILCVWTALSGPYSFAQDSTSVEVEKLKALLAEQQKQIETLRQAVAQQQKTIEGLAKPATQNASVTPAAPAAPVDPATAPAAVRRPLVASSTPMAVPAANPVPKFVPPLPQPEAPSPLQLKIGDTTIIPVGFMDATAVWRDKNAGSGIGSNFGSVPYKNVPAGNLSEFRFSPQNSRLGFRADVDVHGAHVIGYNEFDFLGTSGATNLGITNGAVVPRLRLFWVDVRKDQWEFLAGQSWSMMTPNRKGISALPSDLFYSQVIDVNYLIGLPWTRQPGFRFLYHPNDKITFGLSLEQPDQYIGGSGGAPTVTLPTALASLAGTQFDNQTTFLTTPNLHPDIIAKLAFDPTSRVHVEFAGIERTFKDWNFTTNQHFTKVGGGGSANATFEIAKGLRLISTNDFGDGIGRYIFGQAPDLIVRADGSISPIHLHSHTAGFEATVKNTLLYGYYGGIYVGQNTALDLNGTSLVGFGYKGSANNQNRSIEEYTFGFNQTIWKDAKWGAINYMMQYMYLTRNPWFVATGQPSGAHDNTIYVNLRYTLPGAPPPAK